MSRALLSRIRKLERNRGSEVTVEHAIRFANQEMREGRTEDGSEERWAAFMRERNLRRSSALENAIRAARRLAGLDGTA